MGLVWIDPSTALRMTEGMVESAGEYRVVAVKVFCTSFASLVILSEAKDLFTDSGKHACFLCHSSRPDYRLPTTDY